MSSTVIRKLNPIEISSLKEELNSAEYLWSPHSNDLKETALKDGKSIHIQWCNDSLEVTYEKWELFPKTHQLLKSIVKGNIGRVYWHRLLPGESIEPHTDEYIPFVKSKQLQHRYQIYLDVDQDITIHFNRGNVEGSSISNSIIDFPLRSVHYYKNKSNSILYLLVFDEIAI